MAAGLVDTTEMYLKAVYELEEEGVRPMRARLVERLEQSKPTVSETVARLERDGLMFVDENRTIRFTDSGREMATKVMRKHRLAERLLLDVIGMPWESLHNEACRWEHVMSDEAEAKIADLLKDCTADPYGNPIPPEGVAGPVVPAPEVGYVAVKDFLVSKSAGGECVLERIGEPLQVDEEFLEELARGGLTPGAQARIKSGDGVVTIESLSEEVPVFLTAWAQLHLQVSA